MATREPQPDDIIEPILNTSKWWFAAAGTALGVITLWLIAWGWQLQNGLIVTGLGDWGSGGGVTWGLYIGAFIWWIGVAHGGIILSAAVRLFGMDKYQPVARVAELLTLTALSMAGMYIVMHTGRPDRMVVSVIGAYPWTVTSSPLVWDLTVITLYFVLTATYISLTLRYDIVRLRHKLPDYLAPLYAIITLGYTKKEDEIIERMVWWLALGIIILAPLLLHGGVIPWLFALLPSMPKWQGAVQGPQFLSIALTSAIGGVIIISYGLRSAYDWDHILTDEVFKGLTKWLGLFSLLYIWLQLQQLINGLYAAPLDLRKVTEATITQPIYVDMLILMTIVLGYIFASSLSDKVFSKRRSVIISFMALYATLSEKILFVFEGLEYPTFSLYHAVPGHYTPSPVEIASIFGTVSLCVLLFLIILKLFPVIELHAVESHDDHHDDHDEEASA